MSPHSIRKVISASAAASFPAPQPEILILQQLSPRTKKEAERSPPRPTTCPENFRSHACGGRSAEMPYARVVPTVVEGDGMLETPAKRKTLHLQPAKMCRPSRRCARQVGTFPQTHSKPVGILAHGMQGPEGERPACGARWHALIMLFPTQLTAPMDPFT